MPTKIIIAPKSSMLKADNCNIFRVLCAKTLVIAAIFYMTTQQTIASEQAWQKSLITGDTMLSSHYISKAEECYRRAVSEMRPAAHSPQDEVRCLNSLANSLALENKIDEAVTTYQKALSMLEKSYGHNDVKILPTLFAVGSVYEFAGKHEVAMQYYKRALKIGEKHYGSYCPPFANHLPTADIEKNSRSFHADSASGSRLYSKSALADSQALENLLPKYKEDLLKEEVNSNHDLVSVFNREISAGLKDNVVSNNTIISLPSAKQSCISKRSQRI